MLLKLFKTKKRKQMVVTFTDHGNGVVTTDVKLDKSINVGAAASAIDRIKAEISQGLAQRLKDAKIGRGSSVQRAFIRKQTLGDILQNPQNL